MFNVAVRDFEEHMVCLMRKHPNFRLATIEIDSRTEIESTTEVIILEKKCDNIEKIVKSRDNYYNF